MRKILTLLILGILSLSLASALVVNSVDYGKLYPGDKTSLIISVKNILNTDIDDVSMSLNFANLKLSPVGSSEYSVDELKEGKIREFFYNVKAGSDIVPGDYEIPYTITYTYSGDAKQKTGTIGISVSDKPKVVYTIEDSTAVVGQQGKLSLKLVNKGYGEMKFVSVKLNPNGYTLLSPDYTYIGSVSSDDYETASFDVVYQNQNAQLIADVNYKDSSNNDMYEQVVLPIKVYSREQALQLGIIQKSNTLYYITGIVILIILWYIWRAIKKRQRLKKSFA